MTHTRERARSIDRLEQNGQVLQALFHGLTREEFLWRPAPGKWCPLEILCHLHDEEREDFRARLKHVMDTPEEAMPKIDPPAWVSERKYMEQDFNGMLHRFLEERMHSVEWLRSADDAPWANAYMHPKVGPVSCDLLLTNWVAHDLHHIRQLNNWRYAHLAAHIDVPLDYAGTW